LSGSGTIFIWRRKISIMHDIDALRSDLTSARSRYESRYRHDIFRYRRALWRQFRQELDQVLSFLVRDRNIAVVNEMSRSLLFQSILTEGENGMDLCGWGPPLGIFPLKDLCLGLIGYGTFGVMKTVLTHPHYPEKRNLFLDHLCTIGCDGRTAGAVCIMAGTAILNAVSETCLAEHLQDVAQIVMRTSQYISKDVVTRSNSNTPLPGDPDEIIFMQEQMPRLMMLEHIFLRTISSDIRFPLLEIASDIHLFRHMARQLADSNHRSIQNAAKRDREDWQKFTHLMNRIVSIRTRAGRLHPDCRDAVDLRVEQGLESIAEWMASRQMNQQIAGEA